VFRSADIRRLSVSKRQLYGWRDQGLIESLGGGLFMKAETAGDPDLIEIAARAPTATICLISALVRHGLTDQIPATIHVAIERSKRPPRTKAPVSWHRFGEATFSIDREQIHVAEGYRLGLYGATRSVIDMFRLRHIEGHDVATEALRRWIQEPSNQPSALLSMARHFPTTEKPIRTALEVLL
jgi:predicted transcriptional regulator of viral defense system